MKKIKLICLLIFLGVLVFGFWRGFKNSDLTKVETITVMGASPETETRIRHAIGVKPGDSLWAVPVEATAKTVKNDSWVESAEVSRQFPHTLAISVVERKPFAVLNSGRGQFKFVDESNHVLGKAESDQIAPYPVLSGTGFQQDKDLRAQAIDLLKNLPEDGPLSLADIGDVQFDDEHGYQFTLSRSGILVEIGKDNLPLHVDRARRVVQYLTAHNINATRVDSDYAKKVLVKVRKDR